MKTTDLAKLHNYAMHSGEGPNAVRLVLYRDADAYPTHHMTSALVYRLAAEVELSIAGQVTSRPGWSWEVVADPSGPFVEIQMGNEPSELEKEWARDRLAEAARDASLKRFTL